MSDQVFALVFWWAIKLKIGKSSMRSSISKCDGKDSGKRETCVWFYPGMVRTK